MVFLRPQWEEKGDAAGTTWPVIAVKDSTSFSNPHAAEEALKERRAQKQEAIDEEGKKTMEDSPRTVHSRRRRSLPRRKLKRKRTVTMGFLCRRRP